MPWVTEIIEVSQEETRLLLTGWGSSGKHLWKIFRSLRYTAWFPWDASSNLDIQCQSTKDVLTVLAETPHQVLSQGFSYKVGASTRYHPLAPLMALPKVRTTTHSDDSPSQQPCETVLAQAQQSQHIIRGIKPSWPQPVIPLWSLSCSSSRIIITAFGAFISIFIASLQHSYTLAKFSSGDLTRMKRLI